MFVGLMHVPMSTIFAPGGRVSVRLTGAGLAPNGRVINDGPAETGDVTTAAAEVLAEPDDADPRGPLLLQAVASPTTNKPESTGRRMAVKRGGQWPAMTWVIFWL